MSTQKYELGHSGHLLVLSKKQGQSARELSYCTIDVIEPKVVGSLKNILLQLQKVTRGKSNISAEVSREEDKLKSQFIRQLGQDTAGLQDHLPRSFEYYIDLMINCFQSIMFKPKSNSETIKKFNELLRNNFSEFLKEIQNSVLDKRNEKDQLMYSKSNFIDINV